MNQKIKNLIKGIVIILTFSIVLLIVSKILLLKSEDGIEQMHSFYKQKENTVDVLFLGSSKIYCQIDTGILWDEYGISSFDLGGAEAPSWVCYYHLKEALKTQKPKVIVYDTSILGFRQEVLTQTPTWCVVNNYGYKWNSNRINQLKDNTEDGAFAKLLLPLGTTHTNYSTITKDDFVDSNNSINYKGFDSRETVVAFDTPDMSSVTQRDPVNEKHFIYMEKMIDLANENGIPFIVMVSPYVVTEQEQRYFNTVFDFCDEKNVPYLDFNKMYDEVGLDFSYDMAENIHLNLSGSKKWTEYLGKYVKSNYEIEDHRGDPKYYSWDKDALWNRQDRARFAIANVKEKNEKYELLKNENYILYITLGRFEHEIAQEDKEYLKSLGVTPELIMPGYEFIVNNGQTLFASQEAEFSAFIDDNDVKLLFNEKRDTNSTELRVNNSKYEFNRFEDVRILAYDKVLKKVVFNKTSY